MICVDSSAPRAVQLQLKSRVSELSQQQEFRYLTYNEVVSEVLTKLTELSNQQNYLDVLEEVKRRLDQDAQKFEFSSKISQLKSCMKKARDLHAFIQTANSASNDASVLSKIQSNFEVTAPNNEICLAEELEIKRKMNRKYEKLIEKHLKQAEIAKSMLSDVSENPFFEEIKGLSGTVTLDLSNKQNLQEQFFAGSQETLLLSLETYIQEEQSVSIEKCKAIGAGLASNSAIIDLTLNLNGTGIRGDRLEAIANGFAKNKSIKRLTLNLSSNMISQSDVKILNVGIMNNSSINELVLDLSFNDIQGGGVKDLGFAFSKNNMIKKIDLDVTENDLSKRGFKHYEQFIKAKDTLNTKHNLGTENKRYEVFRDFQRARISQVQSTIVNKKRHAYRISELIE